MKATRQQRLRITGWGIPLAYSAAALAFGMIFPRLEHRFLADWTAGMSATAALAIGSSVASGMIALTGIVFSLTFVMIQFSATAYSPRLVLWVARDPVMSHALGVFNATFLYALTLLAWVDREHSGAMPLLSGWMLFFLLLASIGMFIALVERIGMLQVNRMLIFTGDQGRKAIAGLYPPEGATPAADGLAALAAVPVAQTVTHAGRPRVIQTVDTESLVRLAREAGAMIEFVAAVGDSLIEPAPLLRVRGAHRPLDAAAVRRAIRTGDERTFDQDPKYALRLIADIAIKALSPAINDPTTAVQALDQIEDLLLRLGRLPLDIGAFHDGEGRLRLVIPHPTWEDFLRLALDEIRAYGADSVQVMRRMRALIRNLAAVLPAHRHEALRHWETRLAGTVARSFADQEEKAEASVADRQGLGIGDEKTASPAAPASSTPPVPTQHHHRP